MRLSFKRLLAGSVLALLLSVPVRAAGPLNSPKFWIDNLDSPDEVVLGADEIRELNRRTVAMTDQMAELDSMPSFIPDWMLFDWLLYDGVPYESAYGKRFFSGGRVVGRAFFDSLVDEMNLEGVAAENPVAYGVVVERADLRAFPTEAAIYKRPGKREFDSVQYSSLYPSEPVAILHLSRSGLWGFVQTGSVRGWVMMDKLALGDKETVFSETGGFLVFTGSSVGVYGDSSLGGPESAVPMGAVLGLVGQRHDGGPYAVRFPKRDASGFLYWVTGYIANGADVSEGFLAYTPRNVITEAFKMLGEEYGWGGKDGRRDCSEFIKDLFSTMGVKLPRNSRNQGVAGDLIAYRDGASQIETIAGSLKLARPGITLLGLDSHIMLYLGTRDGKPYAIHQIFGYRDGASFKILNRVAVTGLDLGGRSRAGALKDRLRSITEIRIPGKQG